MEKICLAQIGQLIAILDQRIHSLDQEDELSLDHLANILARNFLVRKNNSIKDPHERDRRIFHSYTRISSEMRQHGLNSEIQKEIKQLCNNILCESVVASADKIAQVTSRLRSLLQLNQVKAFDLEEIEEIDA